MKHVVFLSGPIGTGKTTLGQALAEQLQGHFIDGDDHADPSRPWYCSILQTSRAIIRTGLERLEERPLLVVAYPLGCANWIYFRRKFGDAGIQPHFVSLRASYASIISDRRGRAFDEDERWRIRVMIAEGYGERPFSDLILDTDKADFAATLEELRIAILRRIVT
nr:shikimate kinase [uncultured Roseococcus sp.]